MPGRFMARLDGVVAIVVGLLAVVGGLTLFSPSRAADGDRLIRLVEGELTEQGLADHQFDLATWDAAAAQLQQQAVPYLAGLVGATPDAYTAALRAQVPAVDTAFTELPSALPFAHRILDNLARQQSNFRAAQDLPAPGVSLETGSWLLVAAGGVLALLGVAILLSGRAWTRVAVAVLGAALVIGPLATSFPSNADQTADLLSTLNFDRQVAVRTRAFFEHTRDLFASVDAQVLPLTAATAGVSPAALVADVHARFPALAQALDHQDDITARFEARVRIREQAVDDLREVKQVPLRALGWLVIGAGGVVLLAVGATALAGRRATARSASRPEDVLVHEQ